jgi:DNA invertase Pin-like site-specific DNA recombinase
MYTDEGISAYKNRPQFKIAMKEILTNPDIKGIVVYDLTRFGRSTDELRYNLQKIRDAKKHFVSLRENINVSTTTGQVLLTVLCAIADYERDIIIERMSAGKEWAKTHGTKSGKPMHRPQKDIDMELVKDRRRYGYSFNKIAKEVKVSLPTLIKRAKEEGIQ